MIARFFSDVFVRAAPALLYSFWDMNGEESRNFHVGSAHIRNELQCACAVLIGILSFDLEGLLRSESTTGLAS